MTSREDKIPGPLRRKLLSNEGPTTKTVDPDESLRLYFRAEPGYFLQAKSAVISRGVTIQSEDAGYIAVNTPARNVLDIAGEDSIRHLQERRDPRLHQVADKAISEGVGELYADTLHSNGITGEGALVAVIDHYFHTDNSKYSGRITDTIGDSSYFTSDAEYSGSKQHGTACAEIVADVAPDANLLLATTRGNQTFSQIMDKIESYDPDAATMSLGYHTGMRIDGQDPISSRVSQFTNAGRLFAVSAGNEANGGHWDGPFTNDGNDLMVFDDSLSVPTRYPVYLDPISNPAEIHIHWDADWAQDDQRYEARLYRSETSTTALDTSQTTDPVEILELTPSQNTNRGEWFFIEIERIDATGDEYFDMFHWGRAVFDSSLATAKRSLGIPATSPDDRTLSVAAVQATDTGTTEQEYLKPYSSQGPTQDGRRGLDIAASSMVSTTAVGDYGGYGPLVDGGGFNGTSAASPHMGGTFGLLFDNSVNVGPDEVCDALFDTGQSIQDPDVSAPDEINTEIGRGYADAKTAYDLTQVELSMSADDILSQGGESQVSLSGAEVSKITVRALWLDWEAVTVQPDGASTTNQISSDGTFAFDWGSDQSSVSPSLTITPPDRYIGGSYGIEATGVSSAGTVEASTVFDITF